MTTARASDLRVLTALPHTAAILLVGALRSEGIAARLRRDGLAVVYGFDGGGHATQVLVARHDIERATQLLRDLDTPV